MKHSVYHLVSDNHNKFVDDLQEIKNLIAEWEKLGDHGTKVYKITTEEFDQDVIMLDEEEVFLNELN